MSQKHVITLTVKPPATMPLACALADLGALVLEAGLVPTLVVGSPQRAAAVRCETDQPVGYQTADLLGHRLITELEKAGHRVTHWETNLDQLPDDHEVEQEARATRNQLSRR